MTTAPVVELIIAGTVIGQTETYKINCSSAFQYQGKLKLCPEWLQDLVEEGAAQIFPLNKTLMIKHKDGYLAAYPGDIVFRDPYQVLRSVS